MSMTEEEIRSEPGLQKFVELIDKLGPKEAKKYLKAAGEMLDFTPEGTNKFFQSIGYYDENGEVAEYFRD